MGDKRNALSYHLSLVIYHRIKIQFRAGRNVRAGANDGMHAPVLVVPRGKVRAEVRAARFFAPERGACDERRDVEKIPRSERERRAGDLLKLKERAPD